MAALAVPEDRLEQVIRYMKAEEQAQDEQEKALIKGMCLANMAYLQEAPVIETEENAELYWFVVQAMTLHTYDHRDEVGFIPEGLRPAVNQMKLKTDYST